MTTSESIKRIVEERFGWSFKNRNFEQNFHNFDDDSLYQLYCRLKAGAVDAETIICKALTIGETYFFRNSAHFEALRYQILPQIRKIKQRPLIIWSAGCATGEEPYSLAMAIREWAPELWPNNIRIIATDINACSIEYAMTGQYTNWSMRKIDPYWIQRYFVKQDNKFIVDSSLRDIIQFQQHNLACRTLPSDILLDQTALIICRNVFIYFSDTTIEQTVKLFYRALDKKGALILGHADHSRIPKSYWKTIYSPGTFYFCRNDENIVEKTQAVRIFLPEAANKRFQAAREKITTKVEDRVTHKTKTLEVAKPIQEPPQQQDKPIIVEDLIDKAWAAANCNNWNHARNLLQKIDKSTPLLSSHFLAAVIAERDGDLQTAHTAIKRALFLNKRFVIGHYFLAILYERENKIEDAVRSYHTILRIIDNQNTTTKLLYGDGLTVGRLREIAIWRIYELQIE